MAASVSTAVPVQPDPDATSRVDRIIAEGAMGMGPIARLVGASRGGRPTAPSTVTRWHTHGIRLPDGRLVFLEAIRLGNRLVTSRQAFLRFLHAQQSPAGGQPAAGPVRPPAARNRASEEAAKSLEAMGC